MSTPAIASTIAAHAYLGGICSNGHPPRDVRVDKALVDRGRVHLRVSALDTDRVGMNYGNGLQTQKPPTQR